MKLHELTAELFERIAELTDYHGLCALRLTCREAASKVFRTYTHELFSTHNILLEESVLRKTLEVVNHPVFGPTIEVINVYIDHIIPPDNREKDNRENNYGPLLHQVFCGLKRHGKVNRLDIIDVDRKGRIMPADIGVIAGIGENLHGDDDECDDNPPEFMAIIESLQTSNLKIEIFNMSSSTTAWSLVLGTFREGSTSNLGLRPPVAQLSIVFEQVASLRLQILVVSMMDFATANQEFAKALAALPRLEHLSLDCKDEGPQEYFVDYVVSETFAILKSLELKNFSMPYQDLLTFLRQGCAGSRLSSFTGVDLFLFNHYRDDLRSQDQVDEDLEKEVERVTSVKSQIIRAQISKS